MVILPGWLGQHPLLLAARVIYLDRIHNEN
jgi:hypothetical protein